jgi:hypothetical protein
MSGWCISTNDLARIRSFAQAEEHWNEQKEWPNEHASKRQLAGRRKKHLHLLKNWDDNAFGCVLYSTPIVTYRRDGSVKLRCYDSVSSNQFAWCVSPDGCRPVSHKSRMFWCVETELGDRYYREGPEPLLLTPTSPGSWRLDSVPDMQHEWAYDRKKGAAVQKLIKPYKTWYELTDRLMGVDDHDDRGQYGSRHIETLLSEANNFDAYPALRRNLGHPDLFIQTAYEVYGARHKVPVPHNRLPRTFA